MIATEEKKDSTATEESSENFIDIELGDEEPEDGDSDRVTFSHKGTDFEFTSVSSIIADEIENARANVADYIIQINNFEKQTSKTKLITPEIAEWSFAIDVLRTEAEQYSQMVESLSPQSEPGAKNDIKELMKKIEQAKNHFYAIVNSLDQSAKIGGAK